MAKTETTIPLTPRELEVMELVKQGEVEDDIGLLLGITMNTVKTHMSRIRLKLGVHSKAEAVYVCLKEGYIK